MRNFLLATVLALFSAWPAWAAIQLQAPESAGTGAAFLARAYSDQPVDKFVFRWKGKEYAAPVKKDANGLWMGEMLLPVALAEKPGNHPLAVEAGGASAKTQLKVAVVKRPVQKLTVDKKYVEPPAEVRQRIEADRAKVAKALATRNPSQEWTLPFQRPVPGTVSSQFGLKRVFNGQPRGQHRGLDLRGSQGTPIKALSDGIVVLVDNLYYSGNTVYVNHGGGVFSSYLHMSEAKVKPGDHVKRGDIVGLVGATGRVTGPHLHLGVVVQGQAVDPLPLLESVNHQPVQAGQ